MSSSDYKSNIQMDRTDAIMMVDELNLPYLKDVHVAVMCNREGVNASIAEFR